VEACALLDEFAIIIQVILGALAFSSLICLYRLENIQCIHFVR